MKKSVKNTTNAITVELLNEIFNKEMPTTEEGVNSGYENAMKFISKEYGFCRELKAINAALKELQITDHFNSAGKAYKIAVLITQSLIDRGFSPEQSIEQINKLTGYVKPEKKATKQTTDKGKKAPKITLSKPAANMATNDDRIKAIIEESIGRYFAKLGVTGLK
jgi:hypothetical protein